MRIPFKRGALFFGLFQTNFLNSISFLIETMENKTCLNCGEPIRGRVDKKFCDDQCRNNYNYHQYADANNLMRRINHTLKKNRNILESLELHLEVNILSTLAVSINRGWGPPGGWRSIDSEGVGSERSLCLLGPCF